MVENVIGSIVPQAKYSNSLGHGIDSRNQERGYIIRIDYKL